MEEEMENLNYLFDKKNTNEGVCENCGKTTKQINGVAWNHNFSIYYSIIIKCEKCGFERKKNISFKSFKEAEKFLRLPF